MLLSNRLILLFWAASTAASIDLPRSFAAALPGKREAHAWQGTAGISTAVPMPLPGQRSSRGLLDAVPMALPGHGSSRGLLDVDNNPLDRFLEQRKKRNEERKGQRAWEELSADEKEAVLARTMRNTVHHALAWAAEAFRESDDSYDYMPVEARKYSGRHHSGPGYQHGSSAAAEQHARRSILHEEVQHLPRRRGLLEANEAMQLFLEKRQKKASERHEEHSAREKKAELERLAVMQRYAVQKVDVHHALALAAQAYADSSNNGYDYLPPEARKYSGGHRNSSLHHSSIRAAARHLLGQHSGPGQVSTEPVLCSHNLSGGADKVHPWGEGGEPSDLYVNRDSRWSLGPDGRSRGEWHQRRHILSRSLEQNMDAFVEKKKHSLADRKDVYERRAAGDAAAKTAHEQRVAAAKVIAAAKALKSRISAATAVATALEAAPIPEGSYEYSYSPDEEHSRNDITADPELIPGGSVQPGSGAQESAAGVIAERNSKPAKSWAPHVW